ncbi:hypothetical protein ABPG74_019219 [Tetrahymena malaccensis]
MKKINICIILLALFQISFQYCHYSTKPNQVTNGQCQCFGGFYSDSSNCHICPNNGQTIGVSYSISNCQYCVTDSYYLSQAATSSTGSVCLKCPNNTKVQSNTPQKPQDISDCAYCQNGYYLQTPAVPPQGGNPGQAAVCVQCPNNSSGMFPSSISQCNLCVQGFYVNQKATNSQEAVCSPCPNNTSNMYGMPFTIKYSVQDCNACQPGYYNTSPNGQPTVCQQCPPNTISSGYGSSINSCFCKLNYYMTVAGTSNSAPTCLPCPNGSGNYVTPFIAGDQSQCDICQAGYYMVTSYQDPANGNPGTSAQCQQCPNNSTSDPGVSTSVSSCNMCQVNFYMQTAATSDSSAICLPCPNNSGTLIPVTQQGDQTQCSICTAGYYMAQQFQVAWSADKNVCQCAANYYGAASLATSTQKTQCLSCPNSTTSKEGAAKTQKDCQQPSPSQQNNQQNGSQGVSNLAPLLPKFQKVQKLTLKLNTNKIAVLGATSLASSLIDCKHLSILKLHLSHNHLDKKAISGFSMHLSKCVQLKELELFLDFNNIGPQGVQELAQAIIGCTNLQTLSLNITIQHLNQSRFTSDESRSELILSQKKVS